MRRARMKDRELEKLLWTGKLMMKEMRILSTGFLYLQVIFSNARLSSVEALKF